ncbi:MAG: hypothetical protein JWO48_170 [Bryobacterales bacterium]|nr:hypothetical protein [Bryobacterales bacterium]
MTGRRELFQWLLLACLLSDILDGLIARIFHLRSRLGAFLDSIADMLVSIIAVLGLLAFQKEFLAAHFGPLAVVVALYAAEMLAGLVRYGRLSSFHTVLVRIAAYLQGIFIMSLFLWGYWAGIFYAMIATSVLAYAEELVLLYVLRKWTADVRGLYWVLRRKASDQK